VVLDEPEKEPEDSCVTITVDCIRVHINPGYRYIVVSYLYEGDKVEILETRIVDGVNWGKTVDGWISLDDLI
jgi:hypothetical protein